LHIEDETKFLGLLNQYVADYRSQRQDEIDLLTEAVYTKWKQQRLWLAETAHLAVTIAQNERDFRKTLPNANAPAHLANAIGKSGEELKLYLRYDAQLHRHYRNCLRVYGTYKTAAPPSPRKIRLHQSNPNSHPKKPASRPKRPKSAAGWRSTWALVRSSRRKNRRRSCRSSRRLLRIG